MKQRGMPLFAVVGSVLVGLILLATAAVAISTYVSGRKSIDHLWHALADGVADRTAREALRFLEPALPFAATTGAAMSSGHLDANDEAAVLAWLEISIDANPQFTWASFGRADGTYLALYKWPGKDGERLRRTWRTIIDPQEATAGSNGLIPRARLNDHERDDDGTWRPIAPSLKRYDPRKRPWYLTALAAPEGRGAWQKPYIFLSRLQPGVAYAQRILGPDGTLLGVIAAEFEASPLSRFVAGLKVGRRGRVYLVDNQSGAVVAHPADQVVSMADGKPTVHHASSHPDPMLSRAWKRLQTLDEKARKHAFELDGYLAMARSVGGREALPWTTLAVVPADDFFGGVRAQLKNSLIIGGAVTLLAILIAFLATRRLARSVAEVGDAMHKMASFDIDDKPLAVQRSAIRELRQMGVAASSMKQGLRSFGRYVPYQLVRHLLKSGTEAKLGGEKREMTVLFSDIAGFTPVVERTPSEVVLEALGEYLDRMNKAIGASGGTVCQYLGDAIMAFWGAPDRQQDHALRACRGALAMRAQAEALLKTALAEGKPPLPTRFGINTGEVMVGNIGAPDRFNYAILGDPVNAAARLEGLNKIYGTAIIVGETTAHTVDKAVVLRRLDWVRAKGKARSMAIYELVDLPEEINDAARAAIDAYHRALDTYRARDFSAAGDAFQALVDEPHLNGHAAAVLAERCAQYVASPPGEDWDGAFTMTTK